MNLKDNMADVQKLASILIEGGFSPSDYASLFEKINSSTTTISAAAASGDVKPKKNVKKTTKTEPKSEVASVKSADSPTRVSPKYKMELRKIIAERHGVSTKADQDKILDKFTKDWIKSKHPEDYHDLLKFNESVAKEFIAEQFPSLKEAAEAAEAEEAVEVVEKTIVIDGKPTVVYYDEKSNSVYDDKDNLIGKLDDDAFVPL